MTSLDQTEKVHGDTGPLRQRLLRKFSGKPKASDPLAKKNPKILSLLSARHDWNCYQNMITSTPSEITGEALGLMRVQTAGCPGLRPKVYPEELLLRELGAPRDFAEIR